MHSSEPAASSRQVLFSACSVSLSLPSDLPIEFSAEPVIISWIVFSSTKITKLPHCQQKSAVSDQQPAYGR
jgi:hypothetical protein